MPNRFDTCLERVLQHEGGKVDDSVDRGGRTAYGVTQAVYDCYRAGKGINTGDVWDITPGERRDIYFQNYWNPLRCAQLPEGFDYVVFDAGVNSGPRRAAVWMQQAIGIPSAECDGVVGAQTLRYVHDVMVADEVERTIERFMAIRKDFLDALVARRPEQAKFAKGWANRCAEVKQCALDDMGLA